MLLSDGDLTKELANGRLVLEPWDPAMLQPSSIDVRLDRYFRVFQNSRYTHIDPREQQDELTTPVEPDGDEPFVLHPGEFVLGSTFEAISLPDDLAGRLEGRFWWLTGHRFAPVGVWSSRFGPRYLAERETGAMTSAMARSHIQIRATRT